MNTMPNAKHCRSWIGAAVCGVLSVSVAAPPLAAGNLLPLHTVVKYGDLDISDPNGAAVLYGRIHNAAEIVCSPYDLSGSLSAKFRFNACINEAVAVAVTEVNEPELLAVYVAKTGKPPQALVAAVLTHKLDNR
jgi:UrcA family protein